jgi:hypothetical protein
MEFKGRYGKGYTPVPAGTHKKSARARFGAPHAVPKEHDGLSNLVGAVHDKLDQSVTNSCVGFSLATNIYLTLAAMGIKVPLPSMPGIYFVARAFVRGEDEPLEDLGCNPDAAVHGVEKWGVPTLEQWAFDPATINDEPDVDVVESMFDFRVPGHTYIDSEGAAAVLDTKFVLSQDKPVSLGTNVDTAFEEYAYDPDFKTLITAPVQGDLLGGHMPLLLAYKTLASGRTAFLGLNWWGLQWGMGGFFWADEEWLMQTTDRVVLDVTYGRKPLKAA